jgi:hypothetical protein
LTQETPDIIFNPLEINAVGVSVDSKPIEIASILHPKEQVGFRVTYQAGFDFG